MTRQIAGCSDVGVVAVRSLPLGWTRAVALSSLVVLGGAAQAQDGVATASPLETVIVSASRSAQALQTAPIGATVITAADIKRAGVLEANEAVRKLAGVPGRTDLNGGREYTLDLRGFGETANQNVVVLVDGIRLSENQQAAARLSAIPAATIERIEIVRGGASVLWGDGASAGVINVVTRKSSASGLQGWASVAVESFNGRDLQGSLAVGTGPVVFDVFVRSFQTDGYRDNNDYRQDVVNLGVQVSEGDLRFSLRTQQESEGNGLPGALSFAQFEADPRQASTPQDRGGLSGQRYMGMLSYRFGAWTAQVDAAVRERSSSLTYGGSISESGSTNTQVTPQLIHEGKWGQVSSTTILGADFLRWDYFNQSYVNETGLQSNQAAFFHTDWLFPSATRVAIGARSERVEQSARDLSSGTVQETRRRLSASEIGVNQTVLDGLDVYARLSRSYRLPNVDDNRYLGEPLLPQRNRDQEVGAKWERGMGSAALRVFRQRTDDEIAYDPTVFANVNLDPTQREGVELEGRVRPLRGLEIAATWQHVKARVVEGPYDGLEPVLVAPDAATLRVGYQFDAKQSLDVGLQYRAAMRFGNDQDNRCARRMPSATLLDARYAWVEQSWELAVSGTNLTDEDTYGYAYSCTTGSLYPDAGRTLRVSATLRF